MRLLYRETLGECFAILGLQRMFVAIMTKGVALSKQNLPNQALFFCIIDHFNHLENK